MALQIITLRVDPELAEAAGREAALLGESRNKFIETAMAMRVAYRAARRGEISESVADLEEAATRLVNAIWDE